MASFGVIFETVLFNRYIGNDSISTPINTKNYKYWDFNYYIRNIKYDLGHKKVNFIASLPLTYMLCGKNILKERLTDISEIIPRMIYYNHSFKIVSSFLKKCLIIYKEKIVKIQKIIARQKDYPDIICEIQYHPVHDSYFASAFSGRFMGGIENGMLVIKCLKEGTSQDVVRLVCTYKMSPSLGKSLILHKLEESSSDINKLRTTIDHFMTLSDKWFIPQISDFITQFIQNYLNETLYKMNKTNSITRLQLFVEKSPVLSEYIWETNFSTENERKILGNALNISQKNIKGFIQSNNIGELKQFICKKINIHKINPLNDLPKEIWDDINDCQKNLIKAKEGIRVGLRGRYISSDEIDAANTKLKNAWKKADQWRAKNSCKKI